MRRFHWGRAFKMKPDQVATCLRCAFIFCCLASWRLGNMYVSHIFHYQWHQLPFFVSPVVLFHVFSFKWNIYFIRKITRCVYSIIFQMNMFMMENWFLESWFHLSQTVLSKSGSRQAAFCFSKMQAGVFLVGEKEMEWWSSGPQERASSTEWARFPAQNCQLLFHPLACCPRLSEMLTEDCLGSHLSRSFLAGASVVGKSKGR